MLFSPLGYLRTFLGMVDGTLGQLAVVRLHSLSAHDSLGL